MKRKRSNEDYIHFFQLYIDRRLFLFLLLLVFSIPVVLFHKDLEQLWLRMSAQNMEATTFSYNDVNLAKFQGNVKLLNEQGTLVYQGMFSDGGCNGKGTLYDAHGHKIYTGEFVDNVMEDKSGTLYFDQGKMRKYVGEVHHNMAQGKGIAYQMVDDTYVILYKGDFADGEFEGKGIYYDSDGNIDYEGEFIDNERHGQGILYEEGAYTRKLYQGEFAFGRPQGKGTLYDTFGKAYYTGVMHEGHINFTSFLPSTLEDVEKSFLLPYQIYVYEDTTAIIYKSDLLNLAFFTSEALPIDKKGDEWKLTDGVKPKDVVIASIMMVDNNIDDPNTDTDQVKIDASWQKKYHPHSVNVLMDAYDIFALKLSENESFELYQASIHGIERTHQIVEITSSLSPALTTRVLYPVTELSIGYGYPLYKNELLYTIMLKEDEATRAESERMVK